VPHAVCGGMLSARPGFQEMTALLNSSLMRLQTQPKAVIGGSAGHT
jgi:hypothetical protein